MFVDHTVILKMGDIDARQIPDQNFYLIDKVEAEHQLLVNYARFHKSAAEKFFLLGKAFKEEKNLLITVEKQKKLPQKKTHFTQMKQAAFVYKQMLLNQSFFAH